MSNSEAVTEVEQASVEVRTKVRAAIAQLNDVFIERQSAIKCVWLALLTGSNFILVGDPGTAKTALIRAIYSHVDAARTFTTTCGSFATVDEMFGPLDIAAFKSGAYQRVTAGRLADCELGFLDEMMKANDGTLNGLLTALNERRYANKDIPLWTCGAATNWPEVRARSENVAALWDRMLLRCNVLEVEDEKARLKMLENIDLVRDYQPTVKLTIAELKMARDEIAKTVIADSVRATLLDVEKRLAKENVRNSSRRLGALQNVLRAEAWLRFEAPASDEDPTEPAVRLDDFDVLEHGLWSDRDHIQPLVEVLKTIDHEVVQECITKLQNAHRQCSGNVSLQQTPRMIKLAADAAIEAKKMINTRGARAEGAARIRAEIEKLKLVYHELKCKVDPHLNKAAAAATGSAP